jgi:hypothetical protein
MIIWGNEHQARAQVLGTAVHEGDRAIASLSRGSDGIAALASTDKTLSIWGHGAPTTLAELVDVECGMLIVNWKNKNPQLSTVEFITCDAQHNAAPLMGYARRVSLFVKDRLKNTSLSFKALPVGQHPDDSSILWANTGTSTFCYITSPSKPTFDHANSLLSGLSAANNNNLSLVGSAMSKSRGLAQPNDFSVIYGGFNELRACLATV